MESDPKANEEGESALNPTDSFFIDKTRGFALYPSLELMKLASKRTNKYHLLYQAKAIYKEEDGNPRRYSILCHDAIGSDFIAEHHVFTNGSEELTVYPLTNQADTFENQWRSKGIIDSSNTYVLFQDKEDAITHNAQVQRVDLLPLFSGETLREEKTKTSHFKVSKAYDLQGSYYLAEYYLDEHHEELTISPDFFFDLVKDMKPRKKG